MFRTADETNDAAPPTRGPLSCTNATGGRSRRWGPQTDWRCSDLVCDNPLVTTRLAEERLRVSRPTAVRLLRQLEERGVLSEGKTGIRGQRRYVARELMPAVTEERTGGGR